MTSNKQAPSPTHKHRIKMAWIIGLTVFTVLVSLLAIYDYSKLNANTTHPTDLGVKMEYIGQHKFRCYLWGLLCDSGAYSEYYFATNMTEEQIKAYFKGANFIGKTDGGGANFSSPELAFRTANGQVFVVTYYIGLKPSQLSDSLKSTDEPYGISITEDDYKIAKEAL